MHQLRLRKVARMRKMAKSATDSVEAAALKTISLTVKCLEI